jgi:hypothetical protein
MSRQYERLPIKNFGAHLLRTGDLDPVYIALHNQDWTREQMGRWLVAYWCFYDCGFACYCSELNEDQFWLVMAEAAENQKRSPTGRWPRGRERRHFRGQQAINAVAYLRQQYRWAVEMVDYIAAGAPSYERVSHNVQTHVGFGPWIGFKVADMLERVVAVPIDFTQAAVFMFKDPIKAAIMYWNQSYGEPLELEHQPHKVKNMIIPHVCEELTQKFMRASAPPRHERPVGLQEVETILCKWKSHLNGHYPLNNDIREIREGVKRWTPHTEVAADFLAALPEVGP